MNLVPIKVTIGIKTNKKSAKHAYPDFNSIRERVASWDDDSDWSHYVDRYGGWKYDKVSGHNDNDAESPRGFWMGMLVVPDDFAREAASAFPEQVSIINDAEAGRFYENRVTIVQPEINEDMEVLQSIAAKRQAGIPEDRSDKNALDPDHPQRGRKRNKTKTWAGYKQQRGIEIDNAAAERLRNNAQR